MEEECLSSECLVRKKQTVVTYALPRIFRSPRFSSLMALSTAVDSLIPQVSSTDFNGNTGRISFRTRIVLYTCMNSPDSIDSAKHCRTVKMRQRVEDRASRYLAKLAMPLADHLLKIAPFDQVLLRDDLLRSPTKLKTREEGDGSAALRTVLLHKQLLVLIPFLDVGQDAV